MDGVGASMDYWSEPLQWELKGKAEVERDHPAGHHSGELRHIVGLAQQLHEGRCKDVHRK